MTMTLDELDLYFLNDFSSYGQILAVCTEIGGDRLLPYTFLFIAQPFYGQFFAKNV